MNLLSWFFGLFNRREEPQRTAIDMVEHEIEQRQPRTIPPPYIMAHRARLWRDRKAQDAIEQHHQVHNPHLF